MNRAWAAFTLLVAIGIIAGGLVLILDSPATWTPRRISIELGACLCTSHDEIQRGRCLCDAWKRCDFIGQPRSCAMEEITTGRSDLCGAMPGPVRCP